MVTALRILLLSILNLYWYIIIAAVIASWLVGFGIINNWHPFTRTILRALHAFTEPVFRACPAHYPGDWRPRHLTSDRASDRAIPHQLAFIRQFLLMASPGGQG